MMTTQLSPSSTIELLQDATGFSWKPIMPCELKWRLYPGTKRCVVAVTDDLKHSFNPPLKPLRYYEAITPFTTLCRLVSVVSTREKLNIISIFSKEKVSSSQDSIDF